METNKIYCADNLELLKTFPDNCIDLIVTSPNYNNWRNRRTQASREKYWERTNIIYDKCADKEDDETYEAGQIEIINEMVRILRHTGTICYNHKDRIFEFEVKSPLEWILKTNAKYRQRITWDRCGMQAYNPVRFYRVDEDIYILGKEAKGFTWNKDTAKYLSIWRIVPNKNIYGHNSTFPEELVKRCVEAFTNECDVVLDPYNGTGTTTKVAYEMKRKFVGIDNSRKYCEIAEKRMILALCERRKKMSKETVTEVQMCGTVLRLGDHVKVQYTKGTWSKGGTIEGKITKLWSLEFDNHLQAEVDGAWCFHNYDEIITHYAFKAGAARKRP